MGSVDLGHATHFSLYSTKEKMFKKLAAACISFGLAISISACTPPMPPEILSALAEQEFTCVEGNSMLSVPASTTDMAPGWQASVEAACPGMTFEYQYDISENADLVFTNLGLGASTCKPSLTVPFAVDAAVIVYQLSDGNTFNFTPELLTKIFSGEIKDWSDPFISEVNLGAVYAPGPITIRATAFKPALDALTNWMKRFDSSFDSSKIKSSVTAESASDFNLGEGEIAILPNSIAQELAYMPAGVIAGKDFSVDVVNPDFSSISSAATQFDFESTETELNVTHNSKLKPQPAPGQDVASPPYEAVFVAPLVICGEASLTKRAAARFILRQDQQGAIGATYFVPIPETIRVGALAIVSEGLTLPVIDPENLPAE